MSFGHQDEYKEHLQVKKDPEGDDVLSEIYEAPRTGPVNN